MDCPVCGRRFGADKIQSHVEQCLIDQDASLARSMQDEYNHERPRHQSASQQQPQSAQRAGQAASAQIFPKPQTQVPATYNAPTPLPRNPPVSSPGVQMYNTPSLSSPHQPGIAPRVVNQNSSPNTGSAAVLGAQPADADEYNRKISIAHKHLQQLNASLESFAHRISLIEMRKHERIIPPVEVPAIPPPRYVTLKPSNPAAMASQQGPKSPFVPPLPSSVPPGPVYHDPRHRFFETAQRYYNNQSGANSFFSGAAANPSPRKTPTQPPVYPSSAPPDPRAGRYVSMPPNQKASAQIHPPAAQPKPQAARPIEEDSPNVITDIHVAQIESKWISNILTYPEDAEDLIIGHLTMLFQQRVKDKKLNTESEGDASTRDLSGSGSEANNQLKGLDGKGMVHPVSEYVSQMIETWNEPFLRMTEPTQETIQNAVHMVQGLISTLEDVVLDYYKELSARNVPGNAPLAQLEAAERREQLVRTSVRTAIWPLFYGDVMKLIRAKASAEDEVYNQKVKEYMTMNPAHLGIPKDYWLIDLDTGVGGMFESGPGSGKPQQRTWSMPPYYIAIQTFKELSTLHSPEAKLKCVVKSARDLVDAVADFHSFFGRDAGKYPVGGDELLPIFTYVVIRAGVKNLISETSFMELFISDDMARGEHGYILATLQTVIAFLSVLDNTTISQSVDSVFKIIAKEVEKRRADEESILVKAPHQLNQDAANGSRSSPVPPPVADVHHDAAAATVDVVPSGIHQGSFFDEEPDLNTFDGSSPPPHHLGNSAIELSDFNPRSQ